MRCADPDPGMPQCLAPLTPVEVEAILAAAARTRRPMLDRALVTLSLDTGARRGELAVIRWTMREPPVVEVGTGAARRFLRIGPTTVDALGCLMDAASPELTGLSGALCLDIELTDGGIHERLLQIGVRAGIDGSLTVRRLRRSWLATMLQLAFCEEDVMATLVDHHPEGLRRATAECSLQAQFTRAWRSPLEHLLAADEIDRAA